ncbi:MAG TPA: 7,8-didemethyl-8-hydroxy-5-deazariboflavin synthase subunit CofH, partial [Dehalococcoidia bacterium]
IPNLQVSWVKEGLKLAGFCLNAGANDFMGTLINESISTAAGAQHGQLVRPRELRAHIRAAGRIPAERDTLYRRLRVFETEPETPDVLDTIEDPARFGSYFQLIHLDRFRYEDERRRRQAAGTPAPQP